MLAGASARYVDETVVECRPALMAAAMLLHGVWGSAAAIGGPVFVIVVLLATRLFALVALRAAIRWAGGRERDIMAPEATNGTISQAEFAVLIGHRKEQHAAIKSRAHGVSRHRGKHVLRAARDLAADLAESDGGDTPEVQLAQAEIARLRTRYRGQTAERTERS